MKVHLSTQLWWDSTVFIVIMAEKDELTQRLLAAVFRAISEALSQVEVRRHRVKADYLCFLSRGFKISPLVGFRLIADA